MSHLKSELKLKNINLSHQRLKVLEYLVLHQCHPTVDQIYTDLQKKMPILSKTTVYNTLRILSDAGFVRVLSIEDNETRYDIEIKPHGHFKCESCKTIYNFAVETDSLISSDLAGFMIKDRDVYFKGICPSCHLK